ncbi:MAG TPA: phosphatase PAP2 family protein, partial [Gemmataceae bacterium]|nr:phosphatase PAP2 family protein [Gemmataceae bacterium]
RARLGHVQSLSCATEFLFAHRESCMECESTMPRPRVLFGIAVAAGFLFACWTLAVMRTDGVEAFDESCTRTCFEMASQHRWGFMVFITDLGGVAAMLLLTIVGALWQASLGNRLLALAWIAVMVGCGVLNGGGKHIFGRERPPVELRDRSVLETNASYPSGHAMGSAIGYGLLAYSLFLWQRCWPRRTVILLATIGIVAAVGFSRVYLRAHWFSDVIAGWLLGLTWLFLCLGCLELLRLRPLSLK